MSDVKTQSGKNTARYHVPNLERGLMIFELLADKPDGANISDIASQLQIPKNSVFRIVTTLHAHGYLQRDEKTKCFRLTGKLLSLGYAATGADSLVEKAMDILRRLRDDAGETALLGAMVGGEGIVLEQIPTKQAVKVLVEIGHRFPLHTAAPAKAILAFLPESEREEILGRIRYRRFTDRTVTGKRGIRTALAKIREKGYAVDYGEEIEGINCIGAPVFDHRGYPAAALWVTGPDPRMPVDDFDRIGEIVIREAKELSQRLGWSPL